MRIAVKRMKSGAWAVVFAYGGGYTIFEEHPSFLDAEAAALEWERLLQC